jgi:prolyl oligopeptidase PreP (S9A serine peptidase family)
MREIKFRAWLEDDDGAMSMIDGDSLAFEEYAPIKDHLSQPHIMQYTGIKDQAGKEIYENDIARLKFHTAHYVCEWQDKYARFVWRCLVTDEYRTLAEESEVIGNIYENHELI